MPKFLETALRKQAEKKGFDKERADRYTYGAMNRMDVMHGSKETAKGRALQRKHDREKKGFVRRANEPRSY